MIIAVTITVIAALLTSWWIFKKYRWRIFKTGSTEADAIVLNTSYVGFQGTDCRQTIIQLQVLPEKSKNFVCDVKKMLSASEYTNLQPGRKVRVKYNSYNHRKILILQNFVIKDALTLNDHL